MKGTLTVASGFVIIGSESTPAELGQLSRSARAAIALARLRLSDGFRVATFRPDAAASRYALAAGAIDARLAALSDIVDARHDLTLLGGDLGADADLLAAQVAESSNAALCFEVLDFQRESDHWHIVRDGGRGAREIIRVAGPAVLVISPESEARLYVSRHRRQSVTPDQINPHMAAHDSSGKVAWELTQPRARVGNLAAKNQAAANDRMLDAFGISEGPGANETSRQVIEADPRTCAEHLLRYLAHHGFIDHRRVSTSSLAPGEVTVSPAESAHSSETVKNLCATDETGLNARIRRGPRAISGDLHLLARRPRAVSEAKSASTQIPAKIARRPQSIGVRAATLLRGPRSLP